jgi:hypothetical protein
MTMDEIFAKANELNIKVNLVRYVESYMAPNIWHASLSWHNEGTKVECEAEAKHAEDAIENAWRKFNKTTKHGAGNLLAPPIDMKEEEESNQ